MLSYQHGYHAGNRADVLKHAVLDTLLQKVAGGTGPVLYVETHAARGQYDLTGPQARKRAEADAGIKPLLATPAPAPLESWLALVKHHGVRAYPGSPQLARERLKANARLVLFERHPAEYAELERNMRDDPRVRTLHQDGYGGALRLSPRAGEQIFVLVDPSYETSRDIEALALWTPKALKRWPRGILVLWLPLFRDGREADFGQYLARLDPNVLVAAARWPVRPGQESSLEGSAMVAFGAPETARKPCAAIAACLEAAWRQAP